MTWFRRLPEQGKRNLEGKEEKMNLSMELAEKKGGA